MRISLKVNGYNIKEVRTPWYNAGIEKDENPKGIHRTKSDIKQDSFVEAVREITAKRRKEKQVK